MTYDRANAPQTEASFTVGNHLTAAANARARVWQFCAALPDSVRTTAVLLTSELVTNALESCEEAIHLSLSLQGTDLCVEVIDACDPPSSAGTRPAPAELQWRIQILDILSTAWGTQTDDGGRGRTVWFTLS